MSSRDWDAMLLRSPFLKLTMAVSAAACFHSNTAQRRVER